MIPCYTDLGLGSLRLYSSVTLAIHSETLACRQLSHKLTTSPTIIWRQYLPDRLSTGTAFGCCAILAACRDLINDIGYLRQSTAYTEALPTFRRLYRGSDSYWLAEAGTLWYCCRPLTAEAYINLYSARELHSHLCDRLRTSGP